ncbi:DUF4331 family protein [Bradyrhizobium sp. ma5]|uniref:DUF4331 family protein n=1 Tax=Bradyrhizobium sp. ma5 TaxID=3344828 RepID=UPI0035D50DCC
MSDHIDGPRQIGDPSADLTDLFAFTTSENPARMVIAACVFPSAGTTAMFSNAVDYAFAIRRVSVAGLGDAAKFEPGEEEIRLSCRFDNLKRSTAAADPVQGGMCILPDGRTLPIVVNDEKGTSTPDGVFRVFAGLRSDPFYLAWLVPGVRKGPNLLLHDNVLSIVIEFDATRVLDPGRGSLFGVIAETVPLRPDVIGQKPPRIDWVGRPEQTNIRLGNSEAGPIDLRDLWNQQTPFAIATDLKPVFRERLKASLANWDMRDGVADWTPTALAANVNVFLDDFLLFDIAKPITDTSHLEIEKSAIGGRAHQTGGGRAVNANVIDILMTWLINRDREFIRGGATAATKPGTNTFPYLAAPNAELQAVAYSVDLAAPPDAVWALIGGFDPGWHPLVAKVEMKGSGVGQLRTIETIDGKQIIERLDEVDPSARFYRYTSLSGIPASNYTGMLGIKPKGDGSVVEWRSQFLPDNQPDIVVKAIVSALLKTGLDSLKQRFGGAK